MAFGHEKLNIFYDHDSDDAACLDRTGRANRALSERLHVESHSQFRGERLFGCRGNGLLRLRTVGDWRPRLAAGVL